MLPGEEHRSFRCESMRIKRNLITGIQKREGATSIFVAVPENRRVIIDNPRIFDLGVNLRDVINDEALPFRSRKCPHPPRLLTPSVTSQQHARPALFRSFDVRCRNTDYGTRIIQGAILRGWCWLNRLLEGLTNDI